MSTTREIGLVTRRGSGLITRLQVADPEESTAKNLERIIGRSSRPATREAGYRHRRALHHPNAGGPLAVGFRARGPCFEYDLPSP